MNNNKKTVIEKLTKAVNSKKADVFSKILIVVAIILNAVCAYILLYSIGHYNWNILTFTTFLFIAFGSIIIIIGVIKN